MGHSRNTRTHDSTRAVARGGARTIGRPVVLDLVDTYCGAWNDDDDHRRRESLEAIWADDATFRDPMVELAGHEELATHIGELRGLIPGIHLAWDRRVRRCGDWFTFDWDLTRPGRPTLRGRDVVRLDAGARVSQLIGFWEGR